MEAILSDLGSDPKKSLTLVLHSSLNGRADWLRFGHCKDIELREGMDVD